MAASSLVAGRPHPTCRRLLATCWRLQGNCRWLALTGAAARARHEAVNLLLVETEELSADGRVTLRGRRARHIVEVLRASPGDRLRAGVIGGELGEAEILAVQSADNAAQAVIDIAVTTREPAPPLPPVELILAVPRPKVLARVLRTAACMGVSRIDLVNAWRVDKSHLRSERLEPHALRRELVLGCEQGGSTRLPEIAVHRLLMPFMRGPLRERLARGDARAILAHPRVATAIEAAVPPGTHTPVIVAIGPERGWIERELDSFAALGVTPVFLGDRVLRVETAVAAVLAQLELLRRLVG